MSTVIAWLRQDLRLADNPALFHACRSAEKVVLLYLHAPEELAPWIPGSASRWWLHYSLQALQREVNQRGASLILRSGSSLDVLTELIDKTNASAVYCNALYEPAAVKRDAAVVNRLHELGVAWHIYHGNVLFPPGTIVNKQNTPYRVFTPFWKTCLQALHVEKPLTVPVRINSVKGLTSHTLDELDLLPKISWDSGLKEFWQAGENAAHVKLQKFCLAAVHDYSTLRDLPAVEGTSRLSPHLHFGEISPRQILWRLQNEIQQTGVEKKIETFIRQLGWREFAIHVLHFFPQTTDFAMDQRFNNFPWRHDNDLIQAWQQGKTGFPIIDAGMRELWHTGWMHNRVRMVVASFLTKNGLAPWQDGACWFWDTLVDANLANNSMGWQWVAGCGVDAAPYFRIFNPVTQSKKFDPKGVYIRRWIPELSILPSRYIHEPWIAPPSELLAAKVVLGKTYPQTFLDLSETRARALNYYQSLGEFSRT